MLRIFCICQTNEKKKKNLNANSKRKPPHIFRYHGYCVRIRNGIKESVFSLWRTAYCSRLLKFAIQIVFNIFSNSYLFNFCFNLLAANRQLLFLSLFNWLKHKNMHRYRQYTNNFWKFACIANRRLTFWIQRQKISSKCMTVFHLLIYLFATRK